MNKKYQGEMLTLSHQEWLQKNLAPLGHGLSEYCFSNLFLFRHIHQYRIIKNPYPFLFGVTYDGFTTLMPAFDLKRCSSEALPKGIRDFDCYYPISQSDLKFFDPDLFDYSFNPDDSDYIYSTEKLKNYRGRKLAGKRNLLKQFQSQHSPKILPLSEQTAPDAVFVLNNWLKDVNKKIPETDYGPCQDALLNLHRLNLVGFVYYDKKYPSGFLIAKEVVPGMCVIHFAKGLRGTKGIFQFMFHHIANSFSNQFQWINFEQDLGKPNFRKTKQSYYPDKLLKKYRVSYKNK